jgi:D-glucuronyl C5-epimerase C-terminus.
MISKYLVKKWFKMIFGLSNMYVPQPMGKFFSKTEIRGYYNDLTNKVKKEKRGFGELPLDEETGKPTEFSIQVFQYGLGAYDCFLGSHDKRYLDTFFACVRFAVSKQRSDGGWETFKNRPSPFSSMAQGEGVSLLCRAFVETNDPQYLPLIQKAISFMKSATMKTTEDGPVFYEFVGSPIVLNGWIFSLFGIVDYALLTQKQEDALFLKSCLCKLKKMLPFFDTGKWSLYREDGRYVSSFYMGVHIAQMEALYQLTDDPIFKEFGDRWSKYLHNPFRKMHYFWKKAIQKLKE